VRILFIGTVLSSEILLKVLLNIKAEIIGAITKRKSLFNSDFHDLSPLCDQYDIPCHYSDGIIDASDTLNFISRLKPDTIFCFGWSHLLPKNVLDSVPLGVVGFHPAPLPMGRGRHPIFGRSFLVCKKQLLRSLSWMKEQTVETLSVRRQ
jgi:methionyl-tRNA formyltransferase